jgi:oligosaccharyltransferase complex subunit beta
VLRALALSLPLLLRTHKKYMAGLWRLAAYLAAAVALVGARSSTGDEVLVVLEPALKQEDYSLFFGGLKGQSFRSGVRCDIDI